MKTLTYKSILIILLIAATMIQSNIARAQSVKPNARISGSVLDDQGKAMPFATIALLKAKDSSLVKGSITNDAGAYRFEHVALGNYVIRVTAMGFIKANSKAVNLNPDDKDIKIPTIQLRSSSKTLKEVTVTSTKPLIERKIDRTVMNVENSVLAAGTQQWIF